MGFGWLFIGYFIATLMSINTFGVWFRLIGYAIVLVAAKKLSDYHKDFRYLCLGSILMLVVSAVSAASSVTTFLYDQMLMETKIFSQAFDQIWGYVDMAAVFAFHISLFYPIRAIAKETEVEKISVATVRNFIFLSVYYVLYILCSLPFAFLKGFSASFIGPIILLYLACLILNAIMIGSCYAWICDPSDLEMEQKPSRFAFVNRMRAEAAERKRKKDEAYAAHRQEAQKKKQERKEKPKK